MDDGTLAFEGRVQEDRTGKKCNMVTVTHYRPHGGTWIEIEPQTGTSRLAIKRALLAHFNAKMTIIYMEDQKPLDRPDTFFKCLGCGNIYIAFNHGEPGQHLQKSPFEPAEGDKVLDCYGLCCFEICGECGEMVRKS